MRSRKLPRYVQFMSDNVSHATLVLILLASATSSLRDLQPALRLRPSAGGRPASPLRLSFARVSKVQLLGPAPPESHSPHFRPAQHVLFFTHTFVVCPSPINFSRLRPALGPGNI
ncbi:unnamed protein product [Chondrus crispus]|uniref:Uncharacterized protein n=1 Tax=Chondrus crispus TaxID=2769 RepID=R7QBF9_CHOCR|nr:unnamed protein product [Chondrus crispus]CDF35847.1 unnamed protein product [Chondrus crispus]|eukprot:XP_005715666.1 unnamed protein product [Chondrus crispus]